LLGHTGSDSVVRVDNDGVIFCGDLFWRATIPNMIDATVRDWIQTMMVLQSSAEFAGQAYVPGHGKVGGPADIHNFGAYLVDLRDAVTRHATEPGTGEQRQAAILADLAKTYGQWNYFDHFAAKNILRLQAELK
jgi:glyoxylase-like metal-dependent hydrolase (beta-lactamase superfamily II)